MGEAMIDSKYYRKRIKKDSSFRGSIYLSKILISIIVLLSSLIICNFKSEYRDYYQKHLLEDNIHFYDFKKLLNKIHKKDEEITVSNMNVSNMEVVGDSTKIYSNGEAIYYLKPGIIVFIGEKDYFGKTVIVQGNDGVDIWYSHLDIVEGNLYDYVNGNTILGNALNGELLVTIYQDGKTLSYEEYMED